LEGDAEEVEGESEEAEGKPGEEAESGEIYRMTLPEVVLIGFAVSVTPR
jgi:hypothetical protein